MTVMTNYLNLKAENCKNCYKCIRNCPVKSIGFKDDHARIMSEDCILCGNCFVVCPQHVKEIRSDITAAENLIKSGSPVYASIAPSFAVNYLNEQTGQPYSMSAMRAALKKLGFAGAEETAIGATIVKRRYDEMVNKQEQNVIISSCCHSVNQLIRRYYPEVLPSLAHVVSPMLAHGMDLKRRHGDCKTIFIGPCISKKAEAESYPGLTDCVLTFMELSDWFSRHNILLEETEKEHSDEGLARFFPVPGGILHSMEKSNPLYTYTEVDGVENCIAAIEEIASGKLRNCFVEMSVCSGSCAGGPAASRVKNTGSRNKPVSSYITISSYAGNKDFPVETYSPKDLDKIISPQKKPIIHLGEDAISDVLRKIGKSKPEQELNCGTCGYNTCRDKARAVLEGKANVFMCLPYLLEKAESFSDNIIQNTPNGIIVLNEMLEVQQINEAACRIFNLSPADIMGDQVVRILDPAPFVEAVEEGKSTYNRRAYLPDYEKHVEETILYDKNHRIIIFIMRDVTEETMRKESRENVTRQTIEITDKVIEKQMIAVQEIASLLGETTAETKVALTKLKESILQGDDT
ncbi:4Fe-4S dicluster domain-containing protein [Treponema sp. OttesenSCG-928-L16]|nr:4Fe-4S dicluster domain-containing protein [Treponema sp. OttesenSCG-928-L16]